MRKVKHWELKQSPLVRVWGRVCPKQYSSRNCSVNYSSTQLLSSKVWWLEHMVERRFGSRERSKVIFKCYYTNIHYNMDTIFLHQFLPELYSAYCALNISIMKIIRAISTKGLIVLWLMWSLSSPSSSWSHCRHHIIVVIIHWGLTRLQERYSLYCPHDLI